LATGEMRCGVPGNRSRCDEKRTGEGRISLRKGRRIRGGENPRKKGTEAGMIHLRAKKKKEEKSLKKS